MGRGSFARLLSAAALAALCLCASAPARQQQQQAARVDVAAAPFSPAPYRLGERLTYTVSFSSFPTAAHIQLQVTERGPLYGREGVELRAHVETIGVVSAALYALNNDYATFVDPANGLPYRAQHSIRQGGRVENVTEDYNRPLGDSALAPGRETPVTPGSFDFLSALYRLRALPLTPGASYTLVVRDRDASYNAEVTVTGREMLKTNVGSAGAIVTQVRVRGNSKADDYRLRLYFTDDEQRVPVLIIARHPAGEIRVELASAEVVGGAAAALAPATPTSVQPAVPLPTPPRPTPPGPAARPTPAAGAVAPPAELPFKPGEQLNFNFFLGAGAQPIGTGAFLVRPRARYFNREGLHLVGNLQTVGAGQTLFPVSDQINSYVDPATVLPFRTELTLAEGQRRARFVVSADQGSGSMLFEDGTRVEAPVGTHDLLSVFYALRSFDLTPGKRTGVSLLINKRPRLLFITALRAGTVQLGGQQIAAVELALNTTDPDSEKLALRLWVSTDKRRLPLRLTAQTPLGPVRADLAIIPTTLQ